VAGQDGSYLAEYLLDKNYYVIGLARRSSTRKDYDNLKTVYEDNFNLIYGDLSDPTCISRILHDYKPHEFYNLGAQSHVGHSFQNPAESFRINAESVIMHLHLIKDISPETRYYQAGTSEIIGGLNCPKSGYSENFIPNPRSPYAISKTAAYFSVKNFRESYNMYAVTGILFNHSLPEEVLILQQEK
jgi:GDPmannose 4,6-dehydratase